MPRNPTPRRLRTSVVFDPLQSSALRDYHRTLNPQGTVGDTIRELVFIGLGSMPLDSAVVAARNTAYRQFTRKMRERTARAMADIRNELLAEIPGFSAGDEP